MISLESKGQDEEENFFFCATTATGEGPETLGQLTAQKGAKSAVISNGQYVITVDTLAGKEAFASWFVDFLLQRKVRWLTESLSQILHLHLK